MIDAYFDDEKDFERLMNMMNDNTSSEVIKGSHPFDGLRESLEYANERIDELEAENSRIPELEAENSELESVNSELAARIRELEEKLYGK